ncbi:MAG: hypothetical protein J6U54_10705 [Clostridiales bacterium]|nr:hypothetical protein [Clostridiales bacterium]
MSNVNGSFLDKNGLTYLWGKLKALIGAKASVDDIYGLGTNIASNANLNNLTTPGVYQFTSTDGSNLTNCPITNATFRLEVRYLNSSARYLQILYPQHTNGPTWFVRVRHSDGWSRWHNEDAYGIGKTLTATDNLDNVKDPGRYNFGGTAARTIGSAPAYGIGGELIVEVIQNSNRIRQTFYVNNAKGDAGYFYTRTYVSSNSGEWSNWYRIDGFGTIGVSISNDTDITGLQTGRYYKDSNVSTITGLPSDFTYAAFVLEVSATLLSTRRTMTLYPAGQDDDGVFYRRLETSAGWGPWYKYSGTVVS